MAYLSKNIAFSWNKTQLLMAETMDIRNDIMMCLLLLLHSGAL